MELPQYPTKEQQALYNAKMYARNRLDYVVDWFASFSDDEIHRSCGKPFPNSRVIPIYEKRQKSEEDWFAGIEQTLYRRLNQPIAVLRPYPPEIDIDILTQAQNKLLTTNEGPLSRVHIQPQAVLSSRFLIQPFLPELKSYIVPFEYPRYPTSQEIVRMERKKAFVQEVNGALRQFIIEQFGIEISGAAGPAHIYTSYLYPDRLPILVNPWESLYYRS